MDIMESKIQYHVVYQGITKVHESSKRRITIGCDINCDIAIPRNKYLSDHHVTLLMDIEARNAQVEVVSVNGIVISDQIYKEKQNASLKPGQKLFLVHRPENSDYDITLRYKFESNPDNDNDQNADVPAGETSLAFMEEDKSVREILSDLSKEELIEVLTRMFKHNTNALLDLINDIRSGDRATDTELVDVPGFCKCNNCIFMPTSRENKCCELVNCRSKTHVLKNICLYKENVETAIRSISSIYVFQPKYDNRSMRHAAYRQYVMWQGGHVTARKRIVIPSCCVLAIRNVYPSPDNKYTGFVPGKSLCL